MAFKSAKQTKAEQNQNRGFHRHVPFSKSLKLKAPDKPRSTGEESLLTRNIT